ncbi:hypothetical protein FACS1894147_12490 [Spirochaetia bacterium]|nr:hypothetical protein FACS1894147_12490 [Spirochaetia bacterium]
MPNEKMVINPPKICQPRKENKPPSKYDASVLRGFEVSVFVGVFIFTKKDIIKKEIPTTIQIIEAEVINGSKSILIFPS